MNKHTSGQWVASPEENNNEWGIVSDKWGIAICADAPGDGTAEANARLIAAAPELLDALCNLIYWVNPDGSFPDNLTVREAISEARNAIAKATGE